MTRTLSLDFYTATDAEPERLARIAAANDCRLFTLHLTGGELDDRSRALVTEACERRSFKATCAALGVQMEMLEALVTGPETVLGDFRPALSAAAELGATRANTLFRPDPDGARAIARFGELADICGELGLELVAEVSRRMHARTPTEAAALLRAAGRPNASMMIDALHLFRFDRTVAEVAAVAPLVGRLQLCDGPAASPEDQLKEAVGARLPPGEGDLPLRDLLAAVPADVIVGLEVPMDALRDAGVSAEDRAARVFAAARRLLGEG